MKKHITVHPFLFAVLPVLFLYSHNKGELYLSQLVAPLLVVGLSSLVVWSLLSLVVRDRLRAALLSSLFWVWFFSFGHLHRLVTRLPAADLASPRTSAFVAVYWAVLLVGIGLLTVQRRGLASLSSMLNIAAGALVTWHILAIGGYEFQRVLAYRRVRQAGGINLTGGAHAGVFPNIYYIILDGYARADVLRDIYHYDNRPFLRYLARKGFYVAPRGLANYGQTVLSLAAALNMEYLDQVAARVGVNSNDRAPLARMIQHNRLFGLLRQRGYRIVAFFSEYAPVDLRGADIYIGGGSRWTEFQRLILDTTPLPALCGAWVFEANDQPHAQAVLYAFKHLADTTRLKPPIFVFAHILCPHPPFVFDAHGPVAAGELRARARGRARLRHPEDELREYAQQVQFVNRQTQRAVEALLTGARWPAVIIIQSDHGPSSRTDWFSVERTDARERLGALVACRLPGAEVRLDDDLSPVNIFRIVLNRYFGANLPLLPNDSYYSTTRQPYRFVRVTERVARATEHSARP